jgi:hypothetical protein
VVANHAEPGLRPDSVALQLQKRSGAMVMRIVDSFFFLLGPLGADRLSPEEYALIDFFLHRRSALESGIVSTWPRESSIASSQN